MNFYDFNFNELTTFCANQGLPSATAAHLFRWHYKKFKTGLCAEHNFSPLAQSVFKDKVVYNLPEVSRVLASNDQTVKFQMRLSDGSLVETVLIPFSGKYSLCVSSQVGCAMACTFCFTGLQGYKRHLRTSEIIGQYITARQWLEDHRGTLNPISNIVFMGQGEPLHNFDNVKKACDIFLDQRGLSLAQNKITVSTSGYLPGLEKMMSENFPPVNIALSLHSTQNDVRTQLIPINKKYPLEKVLASLRSLPVKKKRFTTIEYLLIRDLNDSEDEARALAHSLEGIPAFVNLIPFNEFTGSSFRRPSDESVERFKSIVQSHRLPVTIRKTKGDEILAACGQLNLEGTSQISTS